jgi:hypothetical protein
MWAGGRKSLWDFFRIGFLNAGALNLTIVLLCSMANPVLATDFREDLKYRRLTANLQDRAGEVVPNSRVFAYCPKYGLIWPRFVHMQSAGAWVDPPDALTGAEGLRQLELPGAPWQFVALGSRSREGKPFEILCGAVPSVAVADGMDVICKANSQADLLPSGSPLISLNLRAALIRHPAFGVWLPVPLTVPDVRGPWRLSWRDACRVYVTLVDPEQQATYILHLAFSSGTVDSSSLMSDRDLAQLCFVVASSDLRPVSLQWAKGDIGCEGSIPVNADSVVRLSPGDYYISYDLAGPDGTTVRFGPGLLTLRAGQSTKIPVGKGYSVGIDEDFAPARDEAESALAGWLVVADQIGLVAWDWMAPGRRGIPISGEIVLPGGKRFPLKHRSSLLLQLTGKEASDAWNASPRTWRLSNPMRSAIGEEFHALPKRSVKSVRFETEIIPPLIPTVQHFIADAEHVVTCAEAACNRRRASAKIHLNMQLLALASATFNGSSLNLSVLYLGSLRLAQKHIFAHELMHGFNFSHGSHGAVMEYLVALTRSGDGPQWPDQLAKWVFFDRINGRPDYAPLSGHWSDNGRDAPLGVFFYVVNTRGRACLPMLENHENLFCGECEKAGISGDIAMCALLSAAANEDLRQLFRANGCEIDDGKLAVAKALLSKRLKSRP